MIQMKDSLKIIESVLLDLKTCLCYNRDMNNISSNNVCLKCGKTLVVGQKKFCSLSCANSYNGLRRVYPKKPDKFCEECGKKLCGCQKKFCSHSCSATHNNRGSAKLRYCAYCGELLPVIKKHVYKYCGRECMGLAHTKIVTDRLDAKSDFRGENLRTVRKYLIGNHGQI